MKRSLSLALILVLLQTSPAHAQGWGLQFAASLLEGQGYTAEAQQQYRVQGVWGPLPPDYCMDCQDITEVTIWRWEDHSPEVGTGIIHTRERATGETRTTIVQMDVYGRVLGMLPIVGFDFSRPFTVNDPVNDPGEKGGKDTNPPPPPPAPEGAGPVKGWGWTPQNTEMANFYLCAAAGCGGAMLVTFLFGPVIGVGGFAPACTGISIGCAIKAIVWGF